MFGAIRSLISPVTTLILAAFSCRTRNSLVAGSCLIGADACTRCVPLLSSTLSILTGAFISVRPVPLKQLAMQLLALLAMLLAVFAILPILSLIWRPHEVDCAGVAASEASSTSLTGGKTRDSSSELRPVAFRLPSARAATGGELRSFVDDPLDPAFSVLCAGTGASDLPCAVTSLLFGRPVMVFNVTCMEKCLLAAYGGVWSAARLPVRGALLPCAIRR